MSIKIAIKNKISSFVSVSKFKNLNNLFKLLCVLSETIVETKGISKPILIVSRSIANREKMKNNKKTNFLSLSSKFIIFKIGITLN